MKVSCLRANDQAELEPIKVNCSRIPSVPKISSSFGWYKFAKPMLIKHDVLRITNSGVGQKRASGKLAGLVTASWLG